MSQKGSTSKPPPEKLLKSVGKMDGAVWGLLNELNYHPNSLLSSTTMDTYWETIKAIRQAVKKYEEKMNA